MPSQCGGIFPPLLGEYTSSVDGRMAAGRRLAYMRSSQSVSRSGTSRAANTLLGRSIPSRAAFCRFLPPGQAVFLCTSTSGLPRSPRGVQREQGVHVGPPGRRPLQALVAVCVGTRLVVSAQQTHQVQSSGHGKPWPYRPVPSLNAAPYYFAHRTLPIFKCASCIA